MSCERLSETRLKATQGQTIPKSWFLAILMHCVNRYQLLSQICPLRISECWQGFTTGMTSEPAPLAICIQGERTRRVLFSCHVVDHHTKRLENTGGIGQGEPMGASALGLILVIPSPSTTLAAKCQRTPPHLPILAYHRFSLISAGG